MVSLLAGSTVTVSSCQSAIAGAEARFKTAAAKLRVVGSDGRFVYATDDRGIRRIDPNTGAVTSLLPGGQFAPATASVAIAGRYLYAVNNVNGGLAKIDLGSGPATVINSSVTGAIAADDANVWIITGTTLLKINPANGQATTISSQVPTNGYAPTAAISAGSYLYVDVRTSGTSNYTKTIRVAKSNGAGVTLTPNFGNVAGFASDNTGLFVADGGLKTVA
ncbi:DUF5074 domain-containing protein [Actinoplanes sp. NPDC051470]|uniref:DUF5074 domain-containing protein n=1 Tax=Actinoplanes sp. NPDC051470 TaxID=3157224 RepID=UPI0034271BAF